MMTSAPKFAVVAGGGLAWDDHPVEAWTERAEQVPAILHQRCSDKAVKRYAGRAALLVYLNISEYGIRQREIEASLRNATAPAKNAFTAVWVLWKDRAYHTWQNGCPGFRRAREVSRTLCSRGA